MKTIILSTKNSHQDILNYGADLLEELKKLSPTATYDQVATDFSNIPELFDTDEKLVMFNQFSFPDGFSTFTQYLPKFKNIKFLLSPYSAYEGLDLELLKKMGIRYRNNGGANAKSVAQYAVTTMFMLLSKIPIFTQKNVTPDGSIVGEEFHQKTAGIIGFGNVGRELATILQGLGMPVVYYNRSTVKHSAKQVSFEEIFNQDIVFVTIATNDETKRTLAKLPDLLQAKNYLIDISAAEDLYAKHRVVELLNQDKLRGYALELFDPSVDLKSEKNFIATPHIAWCTYDAEKRTIENYLNRAMKIIRGEIDTVDFIV